MNNVYLIQAHKNLEQLQQLLTALKYPNSMFIIHIDAKSTIPPHIKDWILAQQNAWLLDDDKRVNVNWGGFSQILATIQLIKTAHEVLLPDQKAYIHLLSGLDYPLVSQEAVNEFLTKKYGKLFFEIHSLPYKNWANNGGLDRVLYKWEIDEKGYNESYRLYQEQKEQSKINAQGNRKKIHGGSQWWSITRECLAYFHDFIRDNPEILDFFRYTMVPDEMFFHTIIASSPFRKMVVNDHLRHIDWKTGPDFPRTLDMRDAERLAKSQAFFARKIVFPKSLGLINFINSRLQIGSVQTDRSAPTTISQDKTWNEHDWGANHINYSPEWDIHTVLIPRENIMFLDEWIQYHIDLGVRQISLYDNSGSTSTDPISLNGQSVAVTGKNKYGYPIQKLFPKMSDSDLQDELIKITEKYQDRVSLRKWQPTIDGKIVFAQAAACRKHVVEKLHNNPHNKSNWCFFIDMDEFIVPNKTYRVAEILRDAFTLHHASQLVLMQKKFTCRYNLLKMPQPFFVTEICDQLLLNTNGWGQKSAIMYGAYDTDETLVETNKYNIHNLPVKAGISYKIALHDLCFHHYNMNEVNISWANTKPRLRHPWDTSEDFTYTKETVLWSWAQQYKSKRGISDFWDESEFKQFRETTFGKLST